MPYAKEAYRDAEMLYHTVIFVSTFLVYVFSFMLQHLYIQVPVIHKPGTMKTLFTCLRQNLCAFWEPNPDPHLVVIYFSDCCSLSLYSKNNLMYLFSWYIFSRCTNKLQARWWILMYVWCFFLLHSSFTTCTLMDTCLISLGPQSPLPEVFALTLMVMVVLSHHNIHPRLIPASSTYASDHYHRWVWIHCRLQEDFSYEP